MLLGKIYSPISLPATRTDKVYRLNLTIATQVHILEPQWNPSMESQAIGRALRLTQKNEVTVTRYITENTVEEVCVLGTNKIWKLTLYSKSKRGRVRSWNWQSSR